MDNFNDYNNQNGYNNSNNYGGNQNNYGNLNGYDNQNNYNNYGNPNNYDSQNSYNNNGYGYQDNYYNQNNNNQNTVNQGLKFNITGKKKKRGNPIVFLVIILIIGGSIIFLGFVNNKNYKDMVERCSEKTTATVTDISSERKRVRRNKRIRYETYYYPTISYTVNGTPYSVKLSGTTSSTRYSVGKNIIIYYNPDIPTDIYPEGESNGSTLMFIMGGIFIVVGIIATISQLKRRQ
ncbi:MAG: DUF3592 domain-containing protein [Hominimerdicola sp.]